MHDWFSASGPSDDVSDPFSSMCAFSAFKQEEDDAAAEMWKTFKELRVSHLPEDPSERKKRLVKVLWFPICKFFFWR